MLNYSKNNKDLIDLIALRFIDIDIFKKYMIKGSSLANSIEIENLRREINKEILNSTPRSASTKEIERVLGSNYTEKFPSLK